ncbi:winged helix-turn-helix domain-containing protein [Coralloluteibacterium thermophilus]|uniref:Winged helix-turn-helix domain-containing protein n=1 Tax=Coralloluteibacterium thermophilum TaxID=2707049 RepID=A0ABV9NGH7_9GAMM
MNICDLSIPRRRRVLVALNPVGKTRLTAREIAERIGEPGETKVSFTIGVLLREGFIDTVSQKRPYVYVARAERCQERRAADLRRRLERNRKKGIRPLQEYLAQVAAEKLERDREREQKRRERAAKAKPKAVRAIKPRPKPKASQGISIPPRARYITEPAPVLVRAETVEEWMARTGQQPEVLPPGAVSKPIWRTAA